MGASQNWFYYLPPYNAVYLFITHFIISFGKFGPPYLGKTTVATRAMLPSPTSACWVFSCFRHPPNSDKDNRICNVRTRSFARVRTYTHGGWAHRLLEMVHYQRSAVSSCGPLAAGLQCGMHTKFAGVWGCWDEKWKLHKQVSDTRPPCHQDPTNFTNKSLTQDHPAVKTPLTSQTSLWHKTTLLSRPH